jgi:MscS family membrane protein
MAMLYVPNALFTSIIVENATRMSHKHIQETIGLRYADLDKIGAITDGIKAMLSAHLGIDSEQSIIVALNQLADSSLNIMLLACTKTTVLEEYHRVKQDILLKAAEIVAQHEADFAFPTQTLHINQSQD